MSFLRIAQNILSPVLAPAGYAYGSVMACRAKLYKRDSFTRFNPACPCISVGNIGSGGSGKTPLAGWLLAWANSLGMQSVLLSRGYGASPSKLPYLVTAESSVEESGDEPLMLASENPYARVVVDPIRIRSGKWATDQFKPDLMVLDDGFQHMAVRRDLDFVLMTPDDFSDGWNKVIPRGTWREGQKALGRADVFFVKSPAGDFNSMKDLIKEKLGKYKKPVFQFNLQAEGLRLLNGEDSLPFGSDKYLLVSGIGKPEQFSRDSSEFMGQIASEHMIFKDHHPYNAQDVKMIRQKAVQVGAAKIICTPKDAVKLRKLGCEEFYTINLHVEFEESIFFDGTKSCAPNIGPVSFAGWWNRERLAQAYKSRNRQ
ncbi:tetraacyldisaccharide 4'-kinase [Maridesulfovibrio ferrireducens]|uniref:tetraacyldisaccharide 4'-kinase n=1 Tax=Maridesulfovibrio ferrireducens TaxID=246191 RepID=UPI001A217889|nr:tetraacyldisaccharide 4'-kinase [Maridesulfovibrio ferrireducens]MBI9112541.1 tetraacyldisaccharide 4'-kinase [Maridesulfovibrio ferrireducens]